MGFLDRLFGRSEPRPTERDQPTWSTRPRPADDPDALAIARYRYLLRSAPPEDLERAHEEAFAQLTPDQRRRVLQELAPYAPPAEVSAAGDDPRRLARLATRTELRQPGTLERALGGPSMGGLVAGSLLASLAGAFVGTALAQSLLADPAITPEETLAADEPSADESGFTDEGTLDGDFGDFGDV